MREFFWKNWDLQRIWDLTFASDFPRRLLSSPLFQTFTKYERAFFRQRKSMIPYFRSTYPYKYAINIKKLRGKFEHLFTAFCERLKLMPGREFSPDIFAQKVHLSSHYSREFPFVHILFSSFSRIIITDRNKNWFYRTEHVWKVAEKSTCLIWCSDKQT